MRLAALIVVSIAATGASADSKIDQLFNKGKQQLAEKKYAEACETFEKVDQLDTGIGAKLNVAKCYEEWGKLAIAYQWYADAEKMARDTKDKRAAKIKELVDAVDTDVPRLTIKLPTSADITAAGVKLDGKPFLISEFGKEQRVDPGPHTIDYVVGKEPRRKTVKLEKGASTEIELVFEGSVAGDGAKPNPERGEKGPSRNWRKISGIAIGSAGVIGLGIAGLVTLSAKGSYNDALETNCMGATNMCDAEGLRLTADAKSRANTATVVTVISGVAVAAGVVLFLTAPKSVKRERAVYVAPSVSANGAAVIVGGGF